MTDIVTHRHYCQLWRQTTDEWTLY